MAQTLPGSPIVGFYNENTEDFDGHNRIIDISNGKWEVKDTTKAYGFVDLNAQVWFQDYLDDDKVHTYLVTEGYIWTGQYPEANRILTNGNNQSMELDENSLNGHWTYDDKTGMDFFIINDAIISKLCILGEDVEPCFEGSNITSAKFSLENDFNQKLYALLKEVRKLKGGSPIVDELKDKDQLPETEFVVAEEPVTEPVEEEVPEVTPEADPEVEDPTTEGEDPEVEDSAEEPVEEKTEEISENEEKNEDNVVEFSLDDFHNLQDKYCNLETQFNELQDKYNTLETSYNELVEFKLGKEREEKQAMIDSFYMLSEADKEEVLKNMDSYSIDEIEAKLSVICVRNKLDLSGSHESETAETTYSLNDEEEDASESVSPIVSALRQHKKNK